MRKQIIIDIDNNGNCSIDGQGFHGAECDALIKEIEHGIGQSTKRNRKREYSMKQTSRLKIKN